MSVSKEKTQLLYEYDKPIIWNLSCFGNEYQMLILNIFLARLKEFNIKNPISTIHGSYSCKYNGGRSALYFETPENIKNKIKYFNDLGIGIKLTFSNPNIHKNTIDEKEMRWYLDTLNEISGIGNGIICVNDDFAEEVKKQYPNLDLVASHVKMELETKMGITDTTDYYNSKFDLYDIVVMNTYRAFDDDFLSKITHPERVEFIINHSCVTNCPFDKYHHSLIDKMQDLKIKCNNNINVFRTNPDAIKTKKSIDMLVNKCNEMKKLNNYENLTKQHINRNEINYLNNTYGINRFKIEGRDLSKEDLSLSLNRYIINIESCYDIISAKGFDNIQEDLNNLKYKMIC